jgi:hypothetical protein
MMSEQRHLSDIEHVIETQIHTAPSSVLPVLLAVWTKVANWNRSREQKEKIKDKTFGHES